MPATNARTHRMIPLPGPNWTRAVVAGVVVLVAVTVLTVSVMATGDGSPPVTEPKADQRTGDATREPEGQGGVEEEKSKSAKPSKDKAKDEDSDSGGDDGGSGGSTSSYPGSGTYRIKSGGYCLGVGPEPGNPDRPEVFVFDGCGSASPPTKLVKTGSREYQLTVYDPSKGTGCMQVDSPGDGPGLLAAPTSCSGSSLQSVTLKSAGGGYRMTVGSSGVCLGPLRGGASSGEALATRSCDGAVFSIG